MPECLAIQTNQTGPAACPPASPHSPSSKTHALAATNLHKEAQDQFHFAIRNLDLAHSEGWSHDQRIEKSNGRIVTRSVTVNHRLDWMDTEIRGKWRNLRSLIHVETQTAQLDSDEVRRDVRYYISSLAEPASAFQNYIRQHWSIENSCH